LHIYQQILKCGGTINLKTDSETLWFYTLAVIKELGLKIHRKVDNVYQDVPDDPVLTNKTFYELSHLEKGRVIRYVQFSLAEGMYIDPKQHIVCDESEFDT
jgi:tRNA (guanine-N7-)-methyltransferase